MLRLPLLLCLAIYIWGGRVNSTLSPPENRIIRGAEAKIEDFPYQVGLQFSGDQVCGGSVISKSWIVSAAHCFKGWPARYYSVRAGSQFRKDGGTVHQVEKIIFHPEFNITSLNDKDVALIKLLQPLRYNPNVQPVVLPEAGEVFPEGTTAVVSGWGKTEFNVTSNMLLQATGTLTKLEECKKLVDQHPRYLLNDGVLCFSSQGGNTPLLGDSGGPLVSRDKLIGVVSFGYEVPVPFPNVPHIYTNVAAVRTWITSESGI